MNTINSVCNLKKVLKNKANWERMAALFAFGIHIMNKVPSTVLIQWLTHVYCSSGRCARDFYVREWLQKHEKFMILSGGNVSVQWTNMKLYFFIIINNLLQNDIIGI